MSARIALEIRGNASSAWDNVSGPRGATNTVEGLTRSSDLSREGLGMKPTQCSVAECGAVPIARGLCSKHYQRWARKNPELLTPSVRGIPAIDRLLGRCVESDEGCWLYQGPLDRKGYSRIRHDGRKAFGHRITWEHFIGPFPDDLTFDHLCRNKNCVNPWHGEAVPSRINSARSPRNLGVVNAAKTQCPQGHPYDEENVRFARRGRGRVCRICRARSSRRYRNRKKDAS